MSPSSTFITFLFGLTNVIGQTEAFNWANTKHVVSFGDSYSFVQGTSGCPNRTFLGSYLPSQYSYTASTLLNDKIVQNFTGTAEGGPNWLQHLTGCAVADGQYSPANCSTQLWDFAFAGASISEQFLPRHLKTTMPLVNQTQQYLKYGDQVLAPPPVSLDKSKSLVTFWIGVNDIFDSQTYKPSNVTYKDFWNSEINAMFGQSVLSMYKAGYKNFLFVNLPPLDRTPGNQKASTPYPSKSQVDTWNSLLSLYVQAFQKRYTDSKTMMYDANTFLNGVMNNQSNYGITNTNTYCYGWNQLDVLTNPQKYGCASLDQYFWYNDKHL